MACTLRSGEMEKKPLLMTARAPLSLRVNNNARAPKTIKMISSAMTMPFRLEARAQFGGVPQTNSTRARARKKERGIALVAGQRKPTINTKMAAIGTTAISARTPPDKMEKNWLE